MMEVKFLCPCGAKYKFDVEPLHGRLPGPVKRHVCQADGTEFGDQIIAQKLAASAASAPLATSATGAIRIGVPQAAAPLTSVGGSGIVVPSVPRSSKEAAPAATPLVSKPVGETRLSVSVAPAAASPPQAESPPQSFDRRPAAQAQVQKIQAD